MGNVSERAVIATPIGHLLLWGSAAELEGLRIDAQRAAPLFTPKEGALLEAVAQIEAYFAGERISFDLSLRPAQSPRGAALRDGIIAVPYGSTATYGEVARRTDSGPRAVGQACRMNPFPIIVPCHRIVSASGPEHYSGADGIKTKAWLNAHELKHRST